MAIKKLKTAEITLIGCGGEAKEFSVRDTVDKPIATYAIDQFKREQQMVFENDGAEYYVPFHAVDHIITSKIEAEVPDKPSAYGC